jgi:large subunit ribosomal protein L4
METKVYNQKGKEVSTLKLPEEIFGLHWNADLVHQVIVGMQSNKRAGTADSKNRAEVSGGGKKPWQQKGTGRARHGSSRSPIWVGGGVAHGPLAEKNYKKKINSKMKAKALFTILSAKYKEGKIIFVDSIAPAEAKTKEAASIMKDLSSVKDFENLVFEKKNNVTLYSVNKNEATRLSFRNLSNVKIETASQMNPVDIANARYVIITEPKETLEFLASKLSK